MVNVAIEVWIVIVESIVDLTVFRYILEGTLIAYHKISYFEPVLLNIFIDYLTQK